MIDVEPLIISGLERLVPMPSGEGADWENVLRRAGTERRVELSRRQLAFGLAALVAAIVVAITTPVGAAIYEGLGNFSDWLTGHPGKPASSADQRAFEAVNRRWSGFPTGTKLRELIRVKVAGRQYVLLGFRSGSTLCLQLKAPFKHGEVQRCAPASTLAHVREPIVIVEPDFVIVDRRNRPAAQISFGIADDGVSRVDLEATDGTHRAFVGGNAYLFVEDEPNTANRVLRMSVVRSGKRTDVPLPPRFGPAIVPATQPQRVTGPTRVEARIEHPHVGWLNRREGAPHHIEAGPQQRQRLSTFAPDNRHLVKPDPLGDLIVGFDGNCLYFAGGPHAVDAAACGGAFVRGPVWIMISGDAVAGVASDGVARVVLFRADGGNETAPFRDNLFAARFSTTQLPIKVVAYDDRGRVVAIERVPAFGFRRPLPAAAKQLHAVLRTIAPHGTTAVLHTGPRVDHYRCWRVDFSTGQAQAACEVVPLTGPKIDVDVVQPAGRDLFVAGKVDADVTARVELHFENADVITTRPAAGHYLFAIPASHLSNERQSGYVLAIDHHGHRVQRQGIFFRTSG
jgi:hypothetical protein